MRLRYNPKKGWFWIVASTFERSFARGARTKVVGAWFGPYPTAHTAVMDALQVGKV